jgi:hypothetical protein
LPVFTAVACGADACSGGGGEIESGDGLTHPFAGHVERINKIWLQKGRKTNKRNELKPASQQRLLQLMEKMIYSSYTAKVQ